MSLIRPLNLVAWKVAELDEASLLRAETRGYCHDDAFSECRPAQWLQDAS